MIGACRLNNKSMRNIRRNEIYQCLAIDLAMLGVISKEECEMLIGSGIPSNLLLPNGKPGELVSESNLPKQPDFIQTEGDETSGDETQEPIQTPEIVTPNADVVGAAFVTQEPVNDEGRTESDN